MLIKNKLSCKKKSPEMIHETGKWGQIKKFIPMAF